MKIGFIGGIHEDIIRLREALEILHSEKYEMIVCLGDIVGFSSLYYSYPDTRNAHECIKLVREECQYVIAGNHDLFIAKKTPLNSEFDYPVNWYSLDVSEKKRLLNESVWLYEDESNTDLTNDEKEYLSILKEYEILDVGDKKMFISHYASPNLVGDAVEFDPENDGIDAHLSLMRENKCNFAIFSHDLCDGIRLFTEGDVKYFPFGTQKMPEGEFALNGPWVANGTSPNGVMTIDTEKCEIISIPLNNPHFVSSE